MEPVLVSLTPAEWTAVGTGATAVILAATLIFVGWQLLEARGLRREQFRPWVTVGFHFRSNIAFALIKNGGTTAARAVEVQFEPEFVTTRQTAADVPLLAEPIPVLAPGEQRLILLDRVADRLTGDLPKKHTVRLRYEDHRGRSLKPEEYVLDFALLVGTRLPDKAMHDLVEEVRKIREQIAGVSDAEASPTGE